VPFVFCQNSSGMAAVATSCTHVQDVLSRYEAKHSDWTKLPEKAIFQLNDTHPTIAVPELMRLLVDEKVTGSKHAVPHALLT
jgi:glucan phosphorylase